MLHWRVTLLISLDVNLDVCFLQVKRLTSSQSAIPFVTYEIWIELANSY